MQPPQSTPPTTPLPELLLGQLESVIVGQREALKTVLATLLSGGHLLLEDRPGVGKTVLARALGAVLGVPMGRIQGTPDLLPTDITGVHVFQPNTGEWSFRAGPIFTPLLLVDELNRATPKAQSALLEAMAEDQVTVDGTTFEVPVPFMVIATQNPLGEAGTHVLGAAQTDRFAAMLRLGLPGMEAERAVLTGRAGKKNLDTIERVLHDGELVQVLNHVRSIHATDEMVDYILQLVERVRALDPSIWLSVRVSETMLSMSRGHAFMSGRDYVAPEDVQAVATAVLAHRLPPAIGRAAAASALSGVPVPVGSD
ncbi:MAG: MoxR family ATPase [Actinomycetota bacterium]